MIGILCEKPSAARNFAKALGGMSGSYNGELYTITNARGHLYGFCEPSEQVPEAEEAKYKSWNVSNLPWDESIFRWKYEKLDNAGDTLKSIKETLKGCDEVVIATDVDPSGEGFLLAAEILLQQKIKAKKFSRMYFMDETARSIQKAFRERKDVMDITKDPEYLMSFYRSRWDLLSMQWTRISLAFGNGQAVIRQGRLKSAMVKLVGDQLKLVSEYKAIPFYQNRFKDENGVVYTSKKEPVYPRPEDVPKKYNESPVTLDGKEQKRTPPPKLLDLAALSARLAPKGLKSKQVLDTYQKMYEAQVVSYPRTEDKTITPEQFNELLPLVDKMAKVAGVDPALLTHRTPRSTHVKTGGAHGANRPGPNVPDSLDKLSIYGPGAKEIYKTLALNYLAMLAEDYEYEIQKGHVTKYPDFTGTANIPRKQGWKLVFDDEADKDEQENAKGIGTWAKPFVYQGVNQKPQTPTMKWLMKQLEKRDVGTGATRTSTYADVTNEKTKYPLLKDTNGKISMTTYGDMGYGLLPGTHIGDLALTEKVFGEMKEVAEGKLLPEDGLHRIQSLILDDIPVMRKNGEEMRRRLGVKIAVQQQKERYTGIWDSEEVSFSRVFGGHRFTDEECERLCAGEEIVLTGLKGVTGTYHVKGKLNRGKYNGKEYVGFERTAYVNADGSDKEQAADSDYATGVWRKKTVRFKRIWSGHRFTDQEIKDLLDGKVITFQATSGSGMLYTASGKLANQTYNGVKYVGFKADFAKKR